MRLDKHPILLQGHNLVQEIERCGCSEQLTRTVVMAGKLMDNIEKLVNENILFRDGLATELYLKSLTEPNRGSIACRMHTDTNKRGGGHSHTKKQTLVSNTSDLFPVPLLKKFKVLPEGVLNTDSKACNIWLRFENFLAWNHGHD